MCGNAINGDLKEAVVPNWSDHRSNAFDVCYATNRRLSPLEPIDKSLQHK